MSKSTIIAVLNQKGGAGKTTLATHLARAFQLAGDNVLLADSDPQGSARDWYAAAGEENDLPPVVGLDRPALFKELSKITGAAKWVIVDGAPQVHDLAAAAVRTADVVLIPVQPSPYDIWATAELVDLVKQRQEITDGTQPKAAFVVSRQIQGTRLASDVREALDGYDLPIFEAGTVQRVIYANSAAAGATALDLEPNGPAAHEIEAIKTELEAFVR